MAVEQIHEVQQVYRKIVHSMSRPGIISSLENVSADLDYHIPCFKATIHSAMTLLDAEVTFHLLTENHSDISGKISAYTLASETSIAEADYIIALSDATDYSILRAIRECKIGSLINPQLSATWIIESSNLTNAGGMTLSGPGIKNEIKMETRFSPFVWEARNERVKEYPMGIDLIFTDEKAQIACAPRTTVIENSGVR
ncbi:phosphonate C-P lyase system protein PhnH [Virgibacillus sp. NKC19-16]|uniref:phosphonate C-P lyase system protein PhnH n=1 Tax=Virgibacillus salidurans TaxID=2831673 RepID=UPI001F421FB5|nr:phosphonate C-P lyase system protein PhnH [Virgibacillus sp. NKC19-16]UJL45929.1 phosphonate C-P lyase system protein PhnH [Virgibacillus sp. NKC19-16]